MSDPAYKPELCGDEPNPPNPRSVEPICTLIKGHSGLHEWHNESHPEDWPPVCRWWRCSDGEVVGSYPYVKRVSND